MSNKAQPVRSWLIIGISALMAAVLVMLATILSRSDEREEQLGVLMLDKSLSGQVQRAKLVMDTYAWALMEEVPRIQAGGISEDSIALRHWTLLMGNRPAIRAVALADDHGNEWTLERAGTAWNYQVTVRQGDTVYSLLSHWNNHGHRLAPPTHVELPQDPRELAWFSPAIGSGRVSPVWSEESTSGGQTNLFASSSVRDGTNGNEIRVLSFTLDPKLMPLNESDWSKGMATQVFNASWQPIGRSDTTRIAAHWREQVPAIGAANSSTASRLHIGGHRWLYAHQPLYLNGITLHVGMLIGIEGIETLSVKKMTGLWSIMGLLVLLGILLSLVFIQSRNAERQAQMQARRSNVQAKRLARTIGEKEELDREVHHRVKNNLQLVSSLLNLQAQRITDVAAHQEFMRGKRRIDSIALVHHKLYRQSDLSALDLQVFIDDLAKAMSAMYAPQSSTVSHSVDAQGMRCNADTGILMGMLLCELLANSHQHAFPYATAGHISISVRLQGEDSYRLVVRDNGKGFDKNSVQAHHLGLEVVEALTEQLDGTWQISEDGGTRVEVVFRSVVPH